MENAIPAGGIVNTLSGLDKSATPAMDWLRVRNESSVEEPKDGGAAGLAQFTEFQALTERKAAIDAELKGIKARLADLEPRLLEFMTEMGMQSIKAGGRTFYIHRQLWAGKLADADAHQFAEIMRALGLGDMVKESVNAQTLSSWVREQAAELDGAATPEEIVAALPEELREIIKISEVYSVRSRKA